MIIYHENLKSDVCELIINKFDELNEKQIVSVKKKDDVRIYGFEKVLDKNITNFFFDIDTKSSIKFFQKKPLYQTLMVNKTFVAPEKKFNSGSGGGWHRDSYFQNQLKTIFYLTKVSIENGPFTFLEPKLKIFSRFYPTKTRLSNDADKKLDFCSNKISIISDRPGLGFSIISNYIHRGIPLINGVRYAITVYSFYKKNNHFENLKIKI